MEVKTVMGNQIRSGCSFCSCENCRYDANSCAGVCGYHVDLVKPTFEKQDSRILVTLVISNSLRAGLVQRRY